MVGAEREVEREREGLGVVGAEREVEREREGLGVVGAEREVEREREGLGVVGQEREKRVRGLGGMVGSTEEMRGRERKNFICRQP